MTQPACVLPKQALTQESVFCSLFCCSLCSSVIYKRERKKGKKYPTRPLNPLTADFATLSQRVSEPSGFSAQSSPLRQQGRDWTFRLSGGPYCPVQKGEAPSADPSVPRSETAHPKGRRSVTMTSWQDSWVGGQAGQGRGWGACPEPLRPWGLLLIEAPGAQPSSWPPGPG